MTVRACLPWWSFKSFARPRLPFDALLWASHPLTGAKIDNLWSGFRPVYLCRFPDLQEGRKCAVCLRCRNLAALSKLSWMRTWELPQPIKWNGEIKKSKLYESYFNAFLPVIYQLNSSKKLNETKKINPDKNYSLLFRKDEINKFNECRIIFGQPFFGFWSIFEALSSLSGFWALTNLSSFWTLSCISGFWALTNLHLFLLALLGRWQSLFDFPELFKNHIICLLASVNGESQFFDFVFDSVESLFHSVDSRLQTIQSDLKLIHSYFKRVDFYIDFFYLHGVAHW